MAYKQKYWGKLVLLIHFLVIRINNFWPINAIMGCYQSKKQLSLMIRIYIQKGSNGAHGISIYQDRWEDDILAQIYMVNSCQEAIFSQEIAKISLFLKKMNTVHGIVDRK